MFLPAPEQLQIILPLAAFLFLLLGFKNSIYGTIAYFIAMNTKIGDMFPVLGALRIELIIALVVLLQIFIAKGKVAAIFDFGNKIIRTSWLLFGVAMASVVVAIDPTLSWNNGGYNLLKLFLFFIMLVASLRDEGDIRKLVWTFMLLAFWLTYEPLYNFFSGNSKNAGYGAYAVGSLGAAAGHVALANNLCQAIPIILYAFFATKKKSLKAIILVILTFVAVGVIATKSRGGFIGLVTIMAGSVWLAQNKTKAIIAVVGVLLIAAPLVGVQYFNRIATIGGNISENKTKADRVLGLQHGISMMVKKPLLGVGIGCYAMARSRYFSYYLYAHNLYGELFGELGLASFFWFFWIFMVFKTTIEIKKALRDDDSEHRYYRFVINGVQLALVTRLVLGNFSHSAFIYFWFLMAAFTYAIAARVLPGTLAIADESTPD